MKNAVLFSYFSMKHSFCCSLDEPPLELDAYFFLCLHLLSCHVYVSSDSSGETALLSKP